MEFVVKSRSSGSKYEIKAYFDGPDPTITCSCPAGQNGSACKHRFALIDGDDRDVVEASHPLSDLTAALEGSALGSTIAQMREMERTVQMAQTELKKLKRQVANQMLGRA